MPRSAEARGAVKAARLGSLRSCSSAPAVSSRLRCATARQVGQLVTAPLFRLGLETGIEVAVGAGS